MCAILAQAQECRVVQREQRQAGARIAPLKESPARTVVALATASGPRPVTRECVVEAR